MPFYERQPYIQTLHQIVKEVMRGDIRVPRFHRPGTEKTWRPEQRGDLLDSLYRGFPVGTIVLWSTPMLIKTFDVVGGFRIPPEPPSASRRPQRLLLDGHQRLSTLVRILGPGLVEELAEEGVQATRVQPGEEDDAKIKKEEWVFELNSADNSRERFILLKPDTQAARTQLPLDKIFNRVEVNRWIRSRNPELTAAQERAVDGVRDRLREYNMPVAMLAADSLEEATESFKRINPIVTTTTGDFHMVAALAFDADNDPHEQFARARSEHLAPIGWEDVSDNDILRVVMGLLEKRNPAKLDVAELAERVRNDRGLVDRAFQSVVATAQLLRGCGVHGRSALPYSWQVITLAVHLGRTHASGIPSSFDDTTKTAVEKWFWLTTYGEIFSGLNSSVVDRSLAALADLLEGRDWGKMQRDGTWQVRPVASFDFRTARSKACALAMARYQDGGNLEGSAHHALTLGGTSLQLLYAGGKRSQWSDVAIVTPEYGIAAIRAALRRRERNETPITGDQELLERLGISPTDVGTTDELLAVRRDRLLAAEKEFVAKLGLTWAPTD